MVLLASTGFAGCDDDDNKGGGGTDAKTDTLPSDGSATDFRGGDTAGVSDGGIAYDVAPPADLIVAETATAPDAGVRAACLAQPGVCYEYGPDYTDVDVTNHCAPNMGTAIAICPADHGGARIGRCVTTSTAGTLHTIYYKRVDFFSAQNMCVSKGGTWYSL